MFRYQPNGIECRICLTNIDSSMTRAVCKVCNDKTCVNCQRTCEKCLQFACMKDIALREVWSNGFRNMLKMCNKCVKGESLAARMAS